MEAMADAVRIVAIEQLLDWDWVSARSKYLGSTTTTWDSPETEIEFLENRLGYHLAPALGISYVLRWMELNPDEARYYYRKAHKLAEQPLADIRKVLMTEEEDEPYCVAAIAYAHYDLLKKLQTPPDFIRIETRADGLYQVAEFKKRQRKTRPQDVRVGKYFVLSDFLYNREVIRDGMPNLPNSLDGHEVKGMRGLCQHILDPVVEQFGPVSITFGLVSQSAAEALGYKLQQLHTFCPPQGGIGGACDIVIHNHPEPRPVLNWIRDNCVYDRLILYPDSRILCVAWTEIKPRYHCKEWVRVPGSRSQYLDAGREGPVLPLTKPYEAKIGQLDLSDRLPS